MPVEIRELVIRAVVNGSNEKNDDYTSRRDTDEQSIDAIVEECVRQVMKILKKSGDR